jgi:7,8-dihydropterin-6-yl-methyl-4-(beta-D-ribofuranosyl)aminobenzene 5'-phosphate synthase
MGDAIAEQALALATPAGTVVITGCAHPGIAAIAERAAEHLQRPLALAIGGFHLFRSGPGDVESTVQRLLALPVERVAPCHCTGGPGREALRRAFGDRFTPVGVGAELDLAAPAGGDPSAVSRKTPAQS